MEVHHHTHTPLTKWQHYVFEFFMMFLAVFCGAFAEYLLENRFEHDRETQYLTSLISDIKTDSQNVQKTIRANLARAKNFDTLLLLLKNLDTLKTYNSLYPQFIQTTGYNIFGATDGTIQQLKYAGGLRLIRNTEVSDSIMAYYLTVKWVVDQGDVYMRYFDEFHKDAFCLFDYSQIDTLFYKPEQIKNVSVRMDLITYDPQLVKRVYNKLFVMRIIIDSYIEALTALDNHGKGTVAFIKHNYKKIKV